MAILISSRMKIQGSFGDNMTQHCSSRFWQQFFSAIFFPTPVTYIVPGREEIKLPALFINTGSFATSGVTRASELFSMNE
jgi:hypothetical protein